MTSDINARITKWRALCPDPLQDPLRGMAETGLLQSCDSYLDIARIKAALVQQTGLPGVASVWGGRQVVARWFIAGFGNESQRAEWLQRACAVGISEPRVGAHPKLLTTRGDPDGEGFSINGEKAWVTNGPTADGFIVLAITAIADGRKRYSAFLVPRDAPGINVQDMPAFHALRPSRHCQLLLDDVHVPRTALLGREGSAYETMALPFRDIEDAVGTFTLLGALRFAREHLPAPADDAAAASLGAITALNATFAAAAEAVVAALDAGKLHAQAATLAGLHVLAGEIAQRLRGCLDAHDGNAPEAVTQLLADLDVLLSVARGPRHARLMRLGR